MQNLTKLAALALANADAYSELYRRLSPPAFKTARSVLRKKEDLEDAVQNAMIKIWEGLRDKTINPDNIDTVWRNIVLQCATAQKRSEKRHRHESIDLLDDKSQHLIDPAPTPTDQAQQSQQTDRLYAALDSISKFDRLILNQKYLEKKTLRELSAIHNLTMSELRTALKNAKQAARREYKAQEYRRQ